MKRFGLLILLVFTLTLQGCSVFMATKQPDKKDLTVLDIGTDRSYVIGELGAPNWSGEKDGKTIDIFNFTQGYEKRTRVGRAFFHASADIWTLGLWEVFGTPTEMIANGKEFSVEISYDTELKVEALKHLNEKNK